MESLHADSEFEPIRSEFPFINTSDADDHQPDIEWAIRSMKDRVRSTYRMLPYNYIPRLMVVHLVRNTIFWLNAFPVDNGWSSKYSPRYIMTGKHLDYNKHVWAEFGEYVQTHEEHDSDMHEQTVGAICLGPNGNQQGGHYFMSLVTGLCLVRSRWTPLPLPRDAQSRVESLGRQQNVPKTLTFGDRHGLEIPDSLEEIVECSDNDDDTYEFQEDPDTDDFSYGNVEEEAEDINNNNITTQSSISDHSDSHGNTGVDGVPASDDTVISTDLGAPDNNVLGEIAGVEHDMPADEAIDLEAPNESTETTGVEQGVAVDETIKMDDDEDTDDSDPDDTEEAKYKTAEQMGLEAAHDDDGTLPKRVRKKRQMKYVNTTMRCLLGSMWIVYFHLTVMNIPIKFLIFSLIKCRLRLV